MTLRTTHSRNLPFLWVDYGASNLHWYQSSMKHLVIGTYIAYRTSELLLVANDWMMHVDKYFPLRINRRKYTLTNIHVRITSSRSRARDILSMYNKSRRSLYAKVLDVNECACMQQTLLRKAVPVSIGRCFGLRFWGSVEMDAGGGGEPTCTGSLLFTLL